MDKKWAVLMAALMLSTGLVFAQMEGNEEELGNEEINEEILYNEELGNEELMNEEELGNEELTNIEDTAPAGDVGAY